MFFFPKQSLANLHLSVGFFALRWRFKTFSCLLFPKKPWFLFCPFVIPLQLFCGTKFLALCWTESALPQSSAPTCRNTCPISFSLFLPWGGSRNIKEKDRLLSVQLAVASASKKWQWMQLLGGTRRRSMDGGRKGSGVWSSSFLGGLPLNHLLLVLPEQLLLN